MNEYFEQFVNFNPTKDKWFELLCYYHYQTEIYDRSLTELRSPYDKTEAYTANPTVRKLSNINAWHKHKLIRKIAEWENIETKNKTYYKYLSAQGWINEYLALKDHGELDWLSKYI